jgi:hypothetical protein
LRRLDDRFRAAVDQLVREERRGGEHVPMQRLIAYHRGELPAPEAAAVADHLALCGDCTERLLDAAEFLADEEELEAHEADASGQHLTAARAGGLAGCSGARPADAAAHSRPARAPRRKLSLLRSPRFAYGLAAVFAALSLGLLLFVRSSGAPGPPAPMPNEPAYDLAPAGSQRAAAAATTIRLPAPAGSAHLILNPSAAPTAPRHGVRFRRADGRVVWQDESFVPQALGTFRLRLPAGAFPPGRYTIELYGLYDGREEPLGTYPVTLLE